MNLNNDVFKSALVYLQNLKIVYFAIRLPITYFAVISLKTGLLQSHSSMCKLLLYSAATIINCEHLSLWIIIFIKLQVLDMY